MKLITWNVNSIRPRFERLLGVLERHRPDALCLQELKCMEAQFPFEALEEAGYLAAVHGQKTYNGVAILTRDSVEDVRTGFGDGGDESQARVISAELRGVRIINCYAPNGGEVGSEKWAFKLDWLSRLRAHLEAACDPAHDVVLTGDLNVARDEKDVAFPDEWGESVLFHPEAREALERVRSWGLEDVVRAHNPDGGVYTWWDYRGLAFPKGNGLRIDHVFATSALAARCTGAFVDRNERKGKRPSDHAPVVAEFGE